MDLYKWVGKRIFVEFNHGQNGDLVLNGYTPDCIYCESIDKHIPCVIPCTAIRMVWLDESE